MRVNERFCFIRKCAGKNVVIPTVLQAQLFSKRIGLRGKVANCEISLFHRQTFFIYGMEADDFEAASGKVRASSFGRIEMRMLMKFFETEMRS